MLHCCLFPDHRREALTTATIKIRKRRTRLFASLCVCISVCVLLLMRVHNAVHDMTVAVRDNRYVCAPAPRGIKREKTAMFAAKFQIKGCCFFCNNSE